MEPSQQPNSGDNYNNENDVHSLEGTNTVVENQPAQQNTPDPHAVSESSANSETVVRAEKFIFIKRLWQKINVYLLLFIFILVLAAGVVVVLFTKNQSANKPEVATSTQDLSQDSLKQLANSSVTVGSPKQVLNVESNAIFAGSVLVRSNLEVAGGIKIGGDITLPGLTVSGTSRFGEIQADKLSIAGVTNMQNTLTVRNGLNVSGTSKFDGPISAPQVTTNALQVNSDLTLTHHIVAGGPIPSIEKGPALGNGGTATLSGSDTSGSISIGTGSSPPAGCFATINFVNRFTNTPRVIITPVGSSSATVQYYVNRTSTSFSVCTASPAPTGATLGFDYIIFN